MSNNTSYKIILLDSATQQYHTIKQFSIHFPSKYLGSKSATLGTTGHQFHSSKKHTSRKVRIISSSKINRFHVTLYLKTHLQPKIMSPVACTFLTSKQYTSIQNLYINSALSAMGYNYIWPVALRFGDHKYFGLQLRHLESEILIRKKPDTSKLIYRILAWYQHVSGLTSPIL